MERPLCVMLIHGFGGSAHEVAPLAARLEQAGVPCRVAALAGHDPARRSIENLPWQVWVDSAGALYDALAKEYRVAVVGFSMGGLIAAVLHSQRPFAAAVFVNTPVYFWHFPQIIKNLAADFAEAFHYYFIRSAGRVTLYTMVQFLKLLLVARPLLGRVDCPALVVQAENDDSVWPASGRWLFRKLVDCRGLHRPKGGGHLVLLSEVECQEIGERVTAFLAEIQRQSPPEGAL